MKVDNSIALAFKALYNYVPTLGQEKFFHFFERFIISSKDNPLLILSGYAGTGKTSLIATVVNYLNTKKLRFVLLAPTGRAAKVMANYAKTDASTIHRHIYNKRSGKQGQVFFALKPNKRKGCFFIVDEASMIMAENSGSLLKAEQSLLDDIMEFVFAGENCKLMFVGDTAQLPPVGSLLSYALDGDYIKQSYHVTLGKVELNEVVRQLDDSGILYFATHLRQVINQETLHFSGFHPFKNDVHLITGADFMEHLESAISETSIEDVIILTKSNKSANLYNRGLRNQMFMAEGVLDAGDRVMVVKNNYLWAEQSSKMSFIANGDMGQVQRIKNIEVRYGYTFADVEIYFTDFDETIEAKAMLDTIDMESPGLSFAESGKLYEIVDQDLVEEFPFKTERRKELRKNPYLQALHLKLAYAITCHKSQGGQWKHVFLDVGYWGEEPNVEQFRWLYTAVTRASEKLVLVNLPTNLIDGQKVESW